MKNIINFYNKFLENLVIYCVGLFYNWDVNVFKNCIEVGFNYVDISDCRDFICKVLEYFEAV